jgi:hypothetical protein
MTAEATPRGKVICSWCGADLGEKERIEGISHGICPACAAWVLGTLACEELCQVCR